MNIITNPKLLRGAKMKQLTNYQKEVLTKYCKDYFVRKSEYTNFLLYKDDFDFPKYIRLSQAMEVALARICAVCDVLLIVMNSSDDCITFYGASESVLLVVTC